MRLRLFPRRYRIDQAAVDRYLAERAEKARRAEEPRPLGYPCSLPDYRCPTCDRPPAEGTHWWENYDTWQEIHRYRLCCPAGHVWFDTAE